MANDLLCRPQNTNNEFGNLSTMGAAFSQPQSNEKDDAVARRTEEMNLARRFVQAAERKLDQLQSQRGNSTSSDGNNFQLEPDEMKALMAINNSGLMEGVAAGILSFIVLRRIRSSLLKRLQQQTNGASNANSTGTSSTVSSTTTGQHAPKSPFQQIRPIESSSSSAGANASPRMDSIPEAVLKRRSTGASGAFYNVVSWMVDVTVSFYIAAYVSVGRNPDQLLHQVADLPLMPGRSRLVSEFCPEFLAELQDMQNATSTDAVENIGMNDNSNSINMSLRQEALQNPQTPMLKAFLRFCHNCHQRAAYEQLLRRQQGLNDNAPVSIPLPGVPHNVIPQQDSAMDDFRTDEYMDTSNMDSQGDDWSDSSLVMDQEEQRQREDQRRRSGRS